LDFRPIIFKTGEIQTKTAKFKLKSGKSKYKIGDIQTKKKTDFLFGFRQLLLGFSRFLKESGKSKHKNSFFIVWISLILCLDFPD
jgi:hypothetical protein